MLDRISQDLSISGMTFIYPKMTSHSCINMNHVLVNHIAITTRETADDPEDEKDNYLDISEEDEELSQAFDMHNIVISSIHQVCKS